MPLNCGSSWQCSSFASWDIWMHSSAMWALSLSCRLLREVSNLAGRQRGRARSTNLCSECPTSWGLFVYVWRTFEGGSTRSPFIQGHSDWAHVNVAWEMGRALSIVRTISRSQRVTDASSPSSSLFFSPFSLRLALSTGRGSEPLQKWNPASCLSVPLSFCAVRGHRWPRPLVNPIDWWLSGCCFFFYKLEYFTQRGENMDGDGTGWITHKSCCRTQAQLTQARLVVQASYLQISFEGLARWADLFLV